ncbi:MAG: hypothetical protein Q8L87_05345 [Anaerolineales bacterium]|nr:hypothetical protein [Anaerolineales bacterium]
MYKLARQIFFDLFWSRTAFLLATLGSGLGWLQLIFDWAPGPITPIDFWQIDSHVFFSLSLFPHFAFVTAGMCILFIFWLEYLEKPRWQPILWMAITGTMVQLVNPIALATVDAGLAGAMFMGWWKDRRIRWQDFHTIGLVAIVQSPLLAYNYWVLNNDPIWSQFTVQNRTPSPPLEYYLWGFAPFLPFAIIGTIDLLRNRSRASAASLFWIITGFALAYAPLLIQRRFLQNITIPLAILAVQGLMRLFGMSSAQSPFMKRWRSGLVFLFVFVASLSSIQLSLGRALYLQTHPEDLYYPSSLDDAVEWFRDHAQYNDFVLGAEKTSQVLAQKAGLRAYFGHEMETLDYEGKKEQVNSFFAGSADGLASPPIQWVVYGPYEQATNPAFQPPTNLELVFDVRNLKIYKVK